VFSTVPFTRTDEYGSFTVCHTDFRPWVGTQDIYRLRRPRNSIFHHDRGVQKENVTFFSGWCHNDSWSLWTYHSTYKRSTHTQSVLYWSSSFWRYSEQCGQNKDTVIIVNYTRIGLTSMMTLSVYFSSIHTVKLVFWPDNYIHPLSSSPLSPHVICYNKNNSIIPTPARWIRVDHQFFLRDRFLFVKVFGLGNKHTERNLLLSVEQKEDLILSCFCFVWISFIIVDKARDRV
jgi:hypothetical protein